MGAAVVEVEKRGQFQRVHFADEVDILMNKQASEALILWPWWAESEAIRAAMTHAHTMGFADIIETGNYGQHAIEEVDCDDWDYVLVVTK